jgi:hypothetical protein
MFSTLAALPCPSTLLPELLLFETGQVKDRMTPQQFARKYEFKIYVLICWLGWLERTPTL